MPMRTLIERQIKRHGIINIIIAGQTCSGKTTLANNIKKMFSEEYSVNIISQDDYFKDVWDIPRSETGYILLDSEEAFHIDEFKRDVVTLHKCGFVKMPVYDIPTNTRVSKDKMVNLGEINIFEGLHAISVLGEMGNAIKIFMTTEPETCLKRRIERDTLKHGLSEEKIREFWENSIMPMSEIYVFSQMKLADIVMS